MRSWMVALVVLGGVCLRASVADAAGKSSRDTARDSSEGRPSSGAVSSSKKEPTSDAVMAKVIQAIEDEIYDYRREGLFFEVDGNGGGGNTPAEISVYVSKSLSDGGGVAVYDLMPLGQVYRYFGVEKSGLVRLGGDPETISRNMGGSFLTIYMPIDELCDFVAHKSVKGTFIVDPKVSPERLRAAIDRQLQRTGYSFRNDKSLKRGK